MALYSGQSVMDSIRRIVQALRVSSRQAECELGLSGAQLFVLQKLRAIDGRASMSDLAAMTLTHISSVSVVVSRLADAGLVIKAPSPQDGRKTEIQLSSKGRDFLQSQPKTAQSDLIAAVERLPTWERDLLAKLLEKLIEEAGLASAETPMFFEDDGRGEHGTKAPR